MQRCLSMSILLMLLGFSVQVRSAEAAKTAAPSDADLIKSAMSAAPGIAH